MATTLGLDPAPPELRTATVDLLADLFFDLVELTGVERFIEAGAKEATASVRAGRSAGVESVIAFEANPYTHKRFVRKLADVPMRYEHLALSDKRGDLTFRVLLTEDGRPRADGRSSLLARTGYEPGFEEVAVRAVTLDEYFADEDRRPTSMWIDVEGASGGVLRGADGLLADTRVVIIEVEERPVWDGDHWLRPAVVQFLHEHGLVPVARDLQSRYQYNIVLVRADFAQRPSIAVRLDRWTRDVRAMASTAGT